MWGHSDLDLPDREQAQRDAIRELGAPGYEQPGWFDRFSEWLSGLWDSILQWLGERLSGDTGVDPRIWFIPAILITLAVAGYGLYRSRGVVHKKRSLGPLLLDDEVITLSARELLALADRHSAAGQWADAVIARFRGLVALLHEQERLSPRLSHTVRDIVTDAVRAFPELAEKWHSAGDSFSDVRYGDFPATAAMDQDLRTLADACTREAS